MSSPTVHIAANTPSKPTGDRAARSPTTNVRTTSFDDACDNDDDDDDVKYHYTGNGNAERPSLLTRLFEEAVDEDLGPAPTLKNYRPYTEANKKVNVFLTQSPFKRIVNDSREKFKRHSLSIDHGDKSIDQVLFLQHGKTVNRKISLDYVATIDNIEHKVVNSIRSVEYAKTRPAMSVWEYQKRNQQYQENLKLKLADVNDDAKINDLKEYNCKNS